MGTSCCAAVRHQSGPWFSFHSFSWGLHSSPVHMLQAPRLHCSLYLGTSRCFVALSSSPSRKTLPGCPSPEGSSWGELVPGGRKLHLDMWLLLFSRSVVSNSLDPVDSTPGFPVLHILSLGVCSNSSIELIMPSNHLVLCHLLLLLPSVFPSIRLFSNESAFRIRWPKYWSFSFSISPPNAYSGLISFRIDWFNFLALPGTLESFPASQLKSINSSALCLLYFPALSYTFIVWV